MLQTLADMILIKSVSFKGLPTLSYQENDLRNLGLGIYVDITTDNYMYNIYIQKDELFAPP